MPDKTKHTAPNCFYCKKEGLGEPNSFALLKGGASTFKRMTYKNLKSFFELTWHGAHTNEGGKGEYPDTYEYIPIIDEGDKAEFELYFCSIKCLRAFINKSIDLLEEEVKKQQVIVNE